MAQSTLPEGWYGDPSPPGANRWWDGTAWQDHPRPDENAAVGTVDVPRPEASVAAPAEMEGTASAGTARAAPPAPEARELVWSLSSAESPDSGAQPPGDHPAARGTFAAPASTPDLGSANYPPLTRPRRPSPGSPPTSSTRVITATTGAWLLAFSPLFALALIVGAGTLMLVEPAAPAAASAGWAASVLMLLWLVLAVVADFVKLGALGYTTRPSVLWIILGPLPYLIARTVRVHRPTGRGTAPLWVHLVVSLIVGAALAVFALTMSSMVRELAELAGLAELVEFAELAGLSSP